MPLGLNLGKDQWETEPECSPDSSPLAEKQLEIRRQMAIVTHPIAWSNHSNSAQCVVMELLFISRKNKAVSTAITSIDLDLMH